MIVPLVEENKYRVTMKRTDKTPSERPRPATSADRGRSNAKSRAPHTVGATHTIPTTPPSSAEGSVESCAAVASSKADSAIFFLRLFIGTLLFTQAITKSQQYLWLEEEYPTILGLSGADVVSLVGTIEAVSGALLAMGLLTRVTSAVMAVVMFFAAFVLFPSQSFDQAELKVVYAGIYIFLLIAGGGRYSLDRLVCVARAGQRA